MSDAETLDESAILRVLLAWRTRLSAAAWLVTRDTHAAEDIFQSAVVKALSSGARFDAEAALVSWAFIVCRREAIDWCRRRGRETPGLDEAAVECLDSRWLERARERAAERAEALRACVEEAPAESRRLLSLRYADGLPCGEVAERLGIGLDAVYKRLSRVHGLLRACVEGKLAPAGDF